MPGSRFAPPARSRWLRPGQRYTLALGLLVAWFLLTLSLPNLYRAPDESAPPGVGGSPAQVVRPEVPAAVHALSIGLLALVAAVLVWGWIASWRAVRGATGYAPGAEAGNNGSDAEARAPQGLPRESHPGTV